MRAERAWRGVVILHKVGVLMIPAVLEKLQDKKIIELCCINIFTIEEKMLVAEKC